MELKARARRAIAIVGFPAFIACLIAVAIAFKAELVGVFKSAESVRDWVEARGALAVVSFVGLQVFQVVVFVVPGEIVQVAGGFAFGLWAGSLWSTLGILAGSAVNFAVGRLLGRPFVAAVFGPASEARIEAATGGGKAAAGFFLLYLIPGIPKDALTYAAGAGGLPFAAFIIVSTIGRLPGVIGSSYMGAASFDRDYVAAAVVLSVAAALFATGLAFRDKLHDVVARLVERMRRR